MEKSLAIPMLPPRSPDGHKGDYGRILIVAGSRGMSGAACLCGLAALRSGAGLVSVASPFGSMETIASYEPCYTTVALPSDDQGRIDSSAVATILAHPCDAIAIGPGIGRSDGLASLVKRLIVQSPVPLIVDADALNALVGRSDVLRQRRNPTILTPHVGEFSRLINKPTAEIQANRLQLAQQFATSTGTLVVLKGHETIVTDGQNDFVNSTGNPGMATGGSGDVLTGIIAALIGQRLSILDAAKLGVYVHGLAGDLAAASVGQVSLIARDIITALPAAFMQLGKRAASQFAIENPAEEVLSLAVEPPST